MGIFDNPGGESPVYTIPGNNPVPVQSGSDAQTFPDSESDSNLEWVVGPPYGNTDFYRLDVRLQGLQTRIVYVGVPDPDIGGARRWWELYGSYQGAQGIMCGEEFAGLMHAPFDQKLISGAYEVGATWQRTNWEPKYMQMAAMMNVGAAATASRMNSFDYRMLEQFWWNSWSDKADGFIGVYTRTHGWRWIMVRLASHSKTAFSLDPTANDSNFVQWDMELVGLYPFYSKKSTVQTWTNTVATSTDWNIIVDAIDGILQALVADLGPSVAGSSQILADVLPARYVGTNVFSIANKGTVTAYPKYLVSSPGIAWLQNGWNADGSPMMLQLPLLTESDGYIMVDTDPDARTITCATDPVDPVFMQALQSSSLLEILLGPLINSSEPIWRQFKQTFTEAAAIAPRTNANLTAWHSQDGGTITCIMPQNYKMAWG